MNNLKLLPEDIVIYKIKPFLSQKDLHLTNKNDYKKYKNEKISSLSDSKPIISRSYITKIIRKDYAFLFEIILNIMFKHWYKAWKIRYKESVFSCYVDLLNYQCIEYRANSCRNLINSKLEKKGIRKNKFKRIRIRKHKWNN
tara:strand:+ start:6340 stop:6765 length:426 start_codon:yes stop_codon:yes gene_type:complete